MHIQAVVYIGVGIIYQDEMFYRGQFERRDDGRDVYLLFRAGVSMGFGLDDQWLEYREDVVRQHSRTAGIEDAFLDAARNQKDRLIEIPVGPVWCEPRRTVLAKRKL